MESVDTSFEHLVLRPHRKKSPNPTDAKRERNVINRLLKEVESKGFLENLENLAIAAEISPWVVFELGNMVDANYYSTDSKEGEALAILAVDAARIWGSPDQIFGNLLSAANFYLRQKNFDIAYELFDAILRLPIAEGFHERAAAHLALAQNAKSLHSDITFHLECFIRTHGHQLPQHNRKMIAEKIADTYIENYDIPMLIHLAVELENKNIVDTLIGQTETFSLAKIIATVTRVRFLGHRKIAEEIRNRWNSKKGKMQ